ncbi:leucine-rich repeat domain-containing protein [Clostridium estertheticum]|uniref:leucine-rich repeat domain-containing protein n=1 Tax=Clostridium estertheticum TaxID=238834 RepID=UPI001CF0E15C|nr:Ig-like domain-containing protein [Clostridium estertheticum]MCB2340910.1 Ig-like domain-containing protein [Clostridium estertheticum]
MVNKKLFMGLSKITMVAIIISSLSIIVFAKDGDIYKLNDLSKTAFTQAQTANFNNQRKIGLNSSVYGYEYSGKVYKFDDLTSLFTKYTQDITKTKAALSTERTAVGNAGQSVTTLYVQSVSAINATKNLNDAYTLPTTVVATLSDKTTRNLAVTWDKVASTTVAGTYTFTGKLTMVDGLVNTNNITASATLTVTDSTVISDNTDITSKFTDENFKTEVYTLIGKTSPEPILYSDVKNIKKLNVNKEDISSINGIEYFISLTNLDCYENKLTTLDVSKNIALTSLNCSGNKLTTLDVSKNTVLTSFDCHDNKLTTLDISKNIALDGLYCYNNQLTTLDVSKNTVLTWLDCNDNKLTTLDVSKNISLYELDCSSTQLTTLDVSKNTVLTSFDCHDNKLTTLDVSKNISLYRLECYNNQLTTLDVSKNIALDHLNCYDNQLKTLYSITNTWDIYGYRPQYTDSSQTTTTDSLAITIKN